ncbi:MAG TPA: tetratricopeptide repeat protein [Rhizomicrobium sp.]|jgi:tetratricopeptide (TPR) repeat protein|nr:tetratricopeptide repeat protein [Rhizomicrobium sp.]
MTDTAQASPLNEADKHQAVQRALDFLNRGELLAAEGTIGSILANAPDDPDALYLMGVLRRMQNRGEEAELHYRRSIASDPDRPLTHYNLGNLLRAMARNNEAVASFREAIRLKPNYFEAYLNLGIALQTTGDLAAAEKAFRDGLRIQPNSLLLKQCLGAVLNDQNRPREAEAVLRQALALNARDQRQGAALLHNLAVSLKLQRRYRDALETLDRAKALVPEMPLADYNRGNILQGLGLPEEAVEAYRVAIARNPLDILAHSDLNKLLYRLGRKDEFLQSYDEAALLYPDAGHLPMYKGTFLFQLGDYDAAQEHYERAAALLPSHVTPHDGLALILARKGEFKDAVREHEIATKMEPENAHAWVNFSETLLRGGDAKKALSASERAMEIAPEDQHALAVWGLALRKLDDARENWLNDYENFVQVFELGPPDGYTDMESFNRDLNAYLDRLHIDTRESIDQSLRGGTQTADDIFGVGHDLVDRLRARVDEAVAAYIDRMQEDGKHPLLRRRNAAFRYAGSWSSRLHDCGFHTNHVHPKGWISSAYYIAVPEAVEDSNKKEGWIKFGEPAFEAGYEEPVRCAIKPIPGTLVLFPSYMWHGTVPFHAPASRTTIAFDAVPK